jgi:O-antigen biosynthesis protein
MGVINKYYSGQYTLQHSSLTVTEYGGIVATPGFAGVNAYGIASAFIKNSGYIDGGETSPALATYPGLPKNQGSGIGMAGGTVVNEGSIAGGPGYHAADIDSSYFAPGNGGAGIYAIGLAQVTNSGSIAGGAGGKSYSAGVYSNGGYGIDLSAGGTVSNSGQISGGDGGGVNRPGPNGSGGVGVYLKTTGSVSNSGTISGGSGAHLSGTGVVFNGQGALSNSGLIEAGTGTATYIAGDGVKLRDGGTITDSGRITGGSGGTFGGYGVYIERQGGTLDLEHGGVISGGDDALSGHGGAGVVIGGAFTINTAGTISAGAGSGGYALVFGSAADGTMTVSQGATFNGLIGGFHYGDSIDLTNVSPTFIEDHFNPATDTINAGSDGILHFTGDPAFIFSSDGNNGTWVTCACFRRGTSITCAEGGRAVESLKIGDRVMTLAGELKPIRWIGKRHYSAESLSEHPEMLPVMIRAGALGDFLPQRDLWISPEHALYVNGALVPAELLTNGVSIITDESAVSVTYYHLEFDSHEVVFAEGAPAESFVDDDSRQMFDNAAEFGRLYPDVPPQRASFCAPRVEDGEDLEAIRAHLGGLAAVPAASAQLQAHSIGS